VIQGFHDRASEDLFDGRNSKQARKAIPHALFDIAADKLQMLNAATCLEDLHLPLSIHLEALVADRKGQHSIRINQAYRICFIWKTDGPHRVEVVNYH
jgi:proteic killer suppression protein